MLHRRSARCLAALVGATIAAAGPGTVTAHQLTGRYESPLPLSAYLLGAAVAVALSFAFVLLRPALPETATARPDRILNVPCPVRLGLRALGLLA